MRSVGANQDGKHNKSFPSPKKGTILATTPRVWKCGPMLGRPQVLSNVLVVLLLLAAPTGLYQNIYLHYFNKLQGELTCFVKVDKSMFVQLNVYIMLFYFFVNKLRYILKFN